MQIYTSLKLTFQNQYNFFFKYNFYCKKYDKLFIMCYAFDTSLRHKSLRSIQFFMIRKLKNNLNY